MLDLLLFAWFFLSVFAFGVPAVYYLFMHTQAAKSWNIKVDETYVPSVAIMVPAHNEAAIIKFKLENLRQISYPTEKIEIIIVNDASTDDTLSVVNQYVDKNKPFKISVFDSKKHLGKTACLNLALKQVTAEVVVISDADCFWPNDVLLKALPYLSDPEVGAISGRELLLNSKESWVTVSEELYNQTVQALRIGESKLHSTIVFQGGFAAYKRSVLSEFNQVDDSGTALDVIQKNKRALLIPEIGFYTTSPTIWRNKVSIKIRRANQLQQLWLVCLKLLFTGKLVLPKKIAIPEIILHIFNPLILVAVGVVSVVLFIHYPLVCFLLLLDVCPVFLIKRLRTTIFETVQNNVILLVALPSLITKGRFKLWKPVLESRNLLTEDVLKNKHLL
ncbi:MAG: glycosyltransferase [Nitrososphaerota archaeon]|jgi:cellulose synthase/poly-beta-1,6-N-acetylglucosamine synthase-like glycosyltransferase|nr:glycosyltransferase [Nitrososphaerota archaeon]